VKWIAKTESIDAWREARIAELLRNFERDCEHRPSSAEELTRWAETHSLYNPSIKIKGTYSRAVFWLFASAFIFWSGASVISPLLYGVSLLVRS
jgi:hypothetical protein